MTNAILDDQAGTVSLSDEMVISWWMDWHRFLELRQQLLDIRSHAVTTPGFDLDENDPAQREQQVNDNLGVIPIARRTVFEAELDAKRHEIRVAREAQHGISAAELDLLAVERDAIAELLKIARGDKDAGELAAVPTGEGVWYDVDPEVVNRVPNAETYALGNKRRGPSRKTVMYVGLAVIWIVIGFLTYRSLQPAEEEVRVAEITAATINEVELNTWPVRALQLGEREVPVEELGPDTWPNPSADAAGWQAGSVWPLRFCVSLGKDEKLPPEVVVLGHGTNMDRTLQLHDKPSAPPVAEIVSCGSGTTLAYGTLANTASQPFGVVGDALEIPGHGSVRLEDVQVVANGQDVTIPPGRARVLVQLLGPNGVDWPDYTPMLVMSNGTEVRHTATQDTDESGGVVIKYDVDAPAVPITAAWQFVDPDTGAAYRWRITLAPARSRRAELTANTRLSVISAAWERGNLTVDVKVTNTGTADLVIRADDFLATQADQAVSVLPFPEQGRVISAGQDSEMSLTVFASPAQSTLLYLGERGVSIQPPTATSAAGGE